MKILVVDDSEDARDLVSIALESGGYSDVSVAESGRAALDILNVNGAGKGDPFGAILLDIVMPEMDGIETCARIRAEPRLQDVPIIMVTSMNDEASLSQAFIAGANDYITKPYNRTELLARVRSALKLNSELRRRQMRESELLDVTAKMRDGHIAVEYSSIDRLTGFLDRRTADSFISDRKNIRASDWSVLAVQIDSFAQFSRNRPDKDVDALLHAVGQVIAHVPAVLGDIVAHYERGVFIVFLRDEKASRARKMADEISRAVAKKRIAQPESRNSSVATVSIGVASAGPTNDDLRKRFASAVGAMETATAKGGGKTNMA